MTTPARDRDQQGRTTGDEAVGDPVAGDQPATTPHRRSATPPRWPPRSRPAGRTGGRPRAPSRRPTRPVRWRRPTVPRCRTDKLYLLDMFPYPSGAGLHVGHPLGYIGTDVIGRFMRMTGRNVLHTIGYDAFGLPAEQYAVRTGTHPRTTTEANIARYRAQLRRLGFAPRPTAQRRHHRPGVLPLDPVDLHPAVRGLVRRAGRQARARSTHWSRSSPAGTRPTPDGGRGPS